jgi:HAE1 family hydrophobic/amphiphilic exporter-1
VIGGTITSTVLTLLVVPTFYDSLESIKRKIKARWRRRFGAAVQTNPVTLP